MNEWTLQCVDQGQLLEQEEALARLEQQIAQITSGRIRNLRVEACGEGIMLSGRTTTYYVKQLATQIAMESQNSRILQNSIEVV